MTYGQVILILFVVLIGYYGFLIFMDIQHLKAAEAAAQENQSEEEIDITDEACSFQPQLVTRDDKKKEEEKKLEEAGNENASSKVVKMFPFRKKHLQLRILHLKQHHRLKQLSRIMRMPHQLLMLLMKMKLKTLPMQMPKQSRRKLELLPNLTYHRPTANPS